MKNVVANSVKRSLYTAIRLKYFNARFVFGKKLGNDLKIDSVLKPIIRIEKKKIND